MNTVFMNLMWWLFWYICVVNVWGDILMLVMIFEWHTTKVQDSGNLWTTLVVCHSRGTQQWMLLSGVSWPYHTTKIALLLCALVSGTWQTQPLCRVPAVKHMASVSSPVAAPFLLPMVTSSTWQSRLLPTTFLPRGFCRVRPPTDVWPWVFWPLPRALGTRQSVCFP